MRVTATAYRGAADLLLHYMREQRSGYNPVFHDSVHQRSDAILVDDPAHASRFLPVAGGWADASDYLQYGTTSAHATVMLLLAYRDHPAAFGDSVQANGLAGANGQPDVLDEARWGLEWLLKMYPEDDLLLNQVGDDSDHTFWDLPTTDSSDYGWGRGGFRPVYPCTGRPQGLFQYKNRSTGLASTAGKYAAAFAIGAQIFRDRDPRFAATPGSWVVGAGTGAPVPHHPPGQFWPLQLTLLAVLLAVAGAADTCTVVFRGTIVQTVTPDQLRGRVLAADYIVGAGGGQLGNLEAGARGGIRQAIAWTEGGAGRTGKATGRQGWDASRSLPAAPEGSGPPFPPA